ncbi:MAG: DNA polymerase IV, partial [Candidatus Omnitrophica bacterium]|nr:DNA polymerase IV [Candidatus Omnitrophota bacterium]
AMPISQAYQRCPNAVFLPGRMRHYSEISGQIFSILHDFTPDVEPVSVDEAFMDITGTEKLHGCPLEAGRKIKQRIKNELNLTASIGIAPIKMAAKIASDLCKPDGLLEVKRENILNFLWPLDTGKLWGVGPKTKEFLNKRNIFTIGDLARIDKENLYEALGENGIHLYNLAHGIDVREVEESDEAKSVSHEHTFDEDTDDKKVLYETLLMLSEKVSRRLRLDGFKGRTITVKIRLKGFKTYTRASTLFEPTNFVDDIFAKTKELFEGAPVSGAKVRLLGVRVSGFKELYVQDSLFEDKDKNKKERVHKAVDLIKNKFGEKSIHRATH